MTAASSINHPYTPFDWLIFRLWMRLIITLLLIWFLIVLLHLFVWMVFVTDADGISCYERCIHLKCYFCVVSWIKASYNTILCALAQATQEPDTLKIQRVWIMWWWKVIWFLRQIKQKSEPQFRNRSWNFNCNLAFNWDELCLM